MTLSSVSGVGNNGGKEFSFHLSCYPTTPGGIRTIDGVPFCNRSTGGFFHGGRVGDMDVLGLHSDAGCCCLRAVYSL